MYVLILTLKNGVHFQFLYQTKNKAKKMEKRILRKRVGFVGIGDTALIKKREIASIECVPYQPEEVNQ